MRAFAWIIRAWRAYRASRPKCSTCHDTGTMTMMACDQPYIDCYCPAGQENWRKYYEANGLEWPPK